jgi:L-fuconolactonase
MLIDTHAHLWSLARGDYDWLTPDIKPLYRDFGWEDYIADSRQCAPEGVILVQAAATVAETEWLLSVAVRHKAISGVVGWIDFASPVDASRMSGLIASGLLGVRPMLQDMANADDMLSPKCAETYEILCDLGLVFEALVRPHQLPVIAALARRYPKLQIVLDHGGKPAIANSAWQPWADAIADLACFDSVACKLSGLITEADDTADAETLSPYVAHLHNSFGDDRLIWGSDWPVVTQRTSFADWYDQATLLASRLGIAPTALFGGNARRIYLSPEREA